MKKISRLSLFIPFIGAYFLFHMSIIDPFAKEGEDIKYYIDEKNEFIFILLSVMFQLFYLYFAIFKICGYIFF